MNGLNEWLHDQPLMRGALLPVNGENSPTLRYVLSPVVSDDIGKECHAIQGSDGIYVVYVASVPALFAGDY